MPARPAGPPDRPPRCAAARSRDFVLSFTFLRPRRPTPARADFKDDPPVAVVSLGCHTASGRGNDAVMCESSSTVGYFATGFADGSSISVADSLYFPYAPLSCCSPALLLRSGRAFRITRCGCRSLPSGVGCGGPEQGGSLLRGVCDATCVCAPAHPSLTLITALLITVALTARSPPVIAHHPTHAPHPTANHPRTPTAPPHHPPPPTTTPPPPRSLGGRLWRHASFPRRRRGASCPGGVLRDVRGGRGACRGWLRGSG